MADHEHPLRPLVRKVASHVALDEADVAALLALPYTLRVIDPSSYLVREGDAPTSCLVVLDGFAMRHKISGGGERQILALHIPGDPVDLQHLFLDTADHNVQTLTRCQVAWIARADLRALVQSRPAVGQAIMVVTQVDASIFREWLLNIGRRDAQERVAHLLCELAVRLDAQGVVDGHDFTLPMTQEQLADATGLTPVHVNRTLRRLEAEGVLTRQGRRVCFPNWEAIRDVGDFNDRYLHLVRPSA